MGKNVLLHIIYWIGIGVFISPFCLELLQHGKIFIWTSSVGYILLFGWSWLFFLWGRRNKFVFFEMILGCFVALAIEPGFVRAVMFVAEHKSEEDSGSVVGPILSHFINFTALSAILGPALSRWCQNRKKKPV